MISYRQNVAPVTGQPKPRPTPAPVQQPLLDWLTHCADNDIKCPTNDDICDRYSCSLSTAIGRLDKLIDDGKIIVWRGSSKRVIWVVSTGRHTLRPERSASFDRWLIKLREGTAE